MGQGLTLSVDIWDTERTGMVIQSSIPQELTREAEGALLPGEIIQRDPSGYISRVFVPFINSGSLRADGIDLGLQYVYPTSLNVHFAHERSYLNTFS